MMSKPQQSIRISPTKAPEKVEGGRAAVGESIATSKHLGKIVQPSRTDLVDGCNKLVHKPTKVVIFT